MKRSAITQFLAGGVVVLMLFVIGGCVRSVQPILNDNQLSSDDQLLGSWVSSDGTAHGEISRGDSPKKYKLLYTDKDGKASDLLVSLGKVGDLTIAQSTVGDPLPDAGDVYKMHLMPLYSFALVTEMTPSRMTIKLMDDGWFGKYATAHPAELATIKPDGDEVLVIAKTNEIQTFLIRHVSNAGAFGDDGLFVRPGDPTTRPTTQTTAP